MVGLAYDQLCIALTTRHPCMVRMDLYVNQIGFTGRPHDLYYVYQECQDKLLRGASPGLTFHSLKTAYRQSI